jgi:hypothetical protein
MAKSIANIDTTVTFQNWFDKTNEMVDIFQNDAMTASPGGDTTTGDATLVGDFTATNVTATNQIAGDAFASATPGADIDFTSPINVTTGQQVVATFTYGAAGARIRTSTGSLAWDVGLQDSTSGNFIINTGTENPFKFVLTPAGTLTVPTIQATTYLDGNGDPFTSGTSIDQLSDIPDVSTTSPSTGQVLKWNGTEWAPGTDNAGSSTSGVTYAGGDVDGYLVTATGGNTIQGESGIVYAASRLSVIGQGEFTSNLQTGGLFSASGQGSDNNPHTFLGTVQISGNLHATGNVRSQHSSSDSRLKTDLQKIEGALDKVNELTGYTFEYINKPGSRATGLVAQDVEKVLPEVVYEYIEDDGEDYKALRYENMMGLLVEAIKELKQDVDDLKNKIR